MQVSHSLTPSGREFLRRPHAHRFALSAFSSTTGPSSPGILIPECPRTWRAGRGSTEFRPKCWRGGLGAAPMDPWAGRGGAFSEPAYDWRPFAFALAKVGQRLPPIPTAAVLRLRKAQAPDPNVVECWIKHSQAGTSNQRRRAPVLDVGLEIASQ